jgi:hypothetical protein
MNNSALSVIACFATPPVVITAYLVLTRSLNFTYAFDWIALAISVATGIAIALLSLRDFQRQAVAVAILLIMPPALLFYSLYFVCYALGDCL